jgi:hypothetical protein
MQRNQLKYFERYSDFEGIARWSAPFEDLKYSHLCVVPVRSERAALPHLLQSFARASKGLHPLLILVLNSSEVSTDEEILEQTETWQWLRSQYPLKGQFSDALFLGATDFDLFLIDRFSSPHRLPASKGVGTARKIGCDFAAWLRTRQKSQSPFILSTDADAVLPEDYLQALQDTSPNISLGHYSFLHRTEGSRAQQDAMRIYELWLHDYVEGLKNAGSPYCVPALGSIYAIHADSYIQVRGFPERLAGEDFYLMNKLMKLGKAKQIPTRSPIQLAGRISHRVPFGTGPTVARWTLLEDLSSEKIFYHPQCFEILGSFLRGDLITHQAFIPNSALSIFKAAQSSKEFHEQFDALKTLQFIHYLRDHHLPNLSLRELKRGPQAA